MPRGALWRPEKESPGVTDVNTGVDAAKEKESRDSGTLFGRENVSGGVVDTDSNAVASGSALQHRDPPLAVRRQRGGCAYSYGVDHVVTD